jgi:hypothetical protein
MTSLFGGGSSINVNASGTLVPQTLTPTDGQTVFTITNFTYTINTNSLLVWINGMKQIKGVDYTETSSTQFTLASPVLSTDIVEVIGFPLASFFQAGVGTNLTDIPTVAIVQAEAYSWLGTTAGSANAQTGSSIPVPVALGAGMVFRFIAGFTNSSITTLTLGTLGAKTIKKISNGALVDLESGDIVVGGVYQIVYDGTYFQLGGGASVNGASFSKNLLINGGFTINQIAYVSAAALASGNYGHDGWKAGAGGGDYSFTQLASNTQITIAANKTLIQVVEDKNVQSTRYVVSWTGTALGRVGVNSATPSGAYAVSPIIITGQTPGTTMSIEFGNGASAGTLGTVQVEATTGSTASSFEYRDCQVELAKCQRYYETSYDSGVAPGATTTNGSFQLISPGNVNRAWMYVPFKVPKRAAPTVTLYSTTGASGFVRDVTTATDAGASTNSIGAAGFNANVTVAISAVTDQLLGHFTAAARL